MSSVEHSLRARKKAMKKILMIMLAACALMAPVQAKYAPEVRVGEEVKKEVRAAQASMRKLSKKTRWALIAEVLGLCYQTKGQPAYANNAEFHKKEKVHFYRVSEGSRFIGVDGVEYGWCETVYEKPAKEYAEWVKVKQAMEHAGVHAVLQGCADDVTAVCRQTAQRRMQRMPEVMQDALLAELMGLYYVPGGGSAYQARMNGRVNGTDMELEFWQVDGKARFMDRTGTERSVAQMIELREKKDAATRRAWIQTQWCCQLIGKKDALREYADVLKKMKKYQPQAK